MKTILLLVLAASLSASSVHKPSQNEKMYYYAWALYKKNPSAKQSFVLYSKIESIKKTNNSGTNEANMNKITESWQQYLKRKNYPINNEATEWYTSEDEARKAWSAQRTGYISNSDMKIEPQVTDWKQPYL